jgi:hypothetical protein
VDRKSAYLREAQRPIADQLADEKAAIARVKARHDFEAQVEAALEDVETGVDDARADFPDVGEDDLYHEVAQSIAAVYPPAIGAELRRRLGF